VSLNLNSEPKPTVAFGGAYRGKRVLVTGHTGFKGSWLCEWLLSLGADVTGFALAPATSPALFDQLNLEPRLRHVLGDVRDLPAVRRVVEETNPDFVFHLAAQPLVRLSYDQPVETFATNIMGTVNVLEALRLHSSVQVQSSGSGKSGPCTGTKDLNSSPRIIPAVMITTDKCYENREWVHSYREEDPMGGYDPYSSSKGAAELVISAYRRSYFSPSTSNLNLNLNSPRARVASARAGNVIGGGDWSLDRIVPDCIRALQRGESIPVRNKIATRPWQHVLEPLSGYLWLGACLANAHLSPLGPQLTSAFNFGPALSSNRTVADLVQEILKHWPGRWDDKSDPRAVHEAKLLNLATDKAQHYLGWSPVWPFAETIAQTVRWYFEISTDELAALNATQRQIAAYVHAARQQGLRWTVETQSSPPL
jgi:CDP-glucose 4,6-dehydratase